MNNEVSIGEGDKFRQGLLLCVGLGMHSCRCVDNKTSQVDIAISDFVLIGVYSHQVK